MKYTRAGRATGGALALIALAVALGGPTLDRAESAREASARSVANAAPGETALCDVEHPLRARAVALEPPRHGAPFDVRIDVAPHVAVENASVRLISAGAARATGREAVALGMLKAGEEASARFAFTLPDQGHRFLLIFRVQGDGPSGPMARDVTYNVLPNGPADPGIVRVTPDGRSVREYRARRLGS